MTTQMTQSDAEVRFDELHQQQQGRDASIITLVTEGVSLNSATRWYAAWAKDRGHATARVSRKDDVFDRWDRLYTSGMSATNLKDEVVDIVAEFEIAESTVRDYAKAWCEDRGFDYPVINPREAMFSWLKDHDGEDPESMKAEFIAYGESLGRSRSNINEYWKGYELHLFLMS